MLGSQCEKNTANITMSICDIKQSVYYGFSLLHTGDNWREKKCLLESTFWIQFLMYIKNCPSEFGFWCIHTSHYSGCHIENSWISIQIAAHYVVLRACPGIWGNFMFLEHKKKPTLYCIKNTSQLKHMMAFCQRTQHWLKITRQQVHVAPSMGRIIFHWTILILKHWGVSVKPTLPPAY